jgi:hypothetical protein
MADISMSEDHPTHIHGVPSMDSASQMENLVTSVDYHESCRIFYAAVHI